MPGRKPLPLNTWGEIRTYARIDGAWIPKAKVPDGARPTSWRAITNYRGSDGDTRQVERSGPSETKAKTALRTDLSEQAGGGTITLTKGSRVNAAIDLYLARTRERRAGTTYDRYESRIRKHIRPRMGNWLGIEAKPHRITAMLEELRVEHDMAAETLRGIRACISGIMQLFVDHGVLDQNPVKHIADIEGGPVRKARAYDEEEFTDFLAKVDADKRAKRSDLPDLIRFLFGTGTRFGEALAVRWCDCNLTDKPITVIDPDTGERQKLPPHSVWINGNIVAVKGRGLVRHSGKTFTSKGIVGLPAFLVTLLLVRRPVDAVETEVIFPSAILGWRHPSNVQRAVRRLRKRIGYPGFTTHVGRKTVSRVLRAAGHNSRQIADQLRQSSTRTTEQHYMERDLVNPAAAAALDAAHRTR
jgi:integrase